MHRQLLKELDSIWDAFCCVRRSKLRLIILPEIPKGRIFSAQPAFEIDNIVADEVVRRSQVCKSLESERDDVGIIKS